ncbi:MAG: glycosyltransferase [Candidatus Omnitrophica bacterium]|nr:glycosyltransferase [Candidatus Omnitrophota bacterium]
MQLEIKQHYDALAPERDKYRARNKYYYSLLEQQYRYLIPEGKKVLEVGCSTGDLLNTLKPSLGVGIDLSGKCIAIARQKYPSLKFYESTISDFKTTEKFDYIILSGLLGELEDIQGFLESLRTFCTPDTRIVIEYYSYFWQYILKAGEKIRAKIPQKLQNWITHNDICNFLLLAGFDPIKSERCILFPRYIWGVSYLLNKFVAKLPVINALTLNHFVVARAILPPEKEFSVSIIVPCRNEKGNIPAAISRTPQFGLKQEFIFVEGGSKDGTYEEVERVIRENPDKKITLLKQKGIGKGDAVRLGFEHAQYDILMILDADLTVAPEELPKFYQAIKEGHGEFINGCRLVYPMEDEAMRFLNLLGNKFFSLFFTWLLGQRFKDTLCGTKVMFRKQYLDLVANRKYFGDFDPFGDFDLIFGAIKLNLKVVELPIRYKSRSYGTTQIQRFRHGWLLLQMCAFAMRKIKFI